MSGLFAAMRSYGNFTSREAGLPAGDGNRLPATVRAAPLLWLSAAGLAGGLALRFGFSERPAADALLLAVLVVAGLPLTIRTVRELLSGRLEADVIATLAIVGSLALGEYLAGVIIVVMQTSGEALERLAFRRASGALQSLIARRPRTAHRLSNGHITDIDADQVRTGDRLLIRPGELAPVDARVLAGASMVDQSALTGEPAPVAVALGAELLSGSVNIEGALEVVALRPAAASQYERIVTLVREAQADRPPMQRLAGRAAALFTPLTLLLCAIGWVATGDPATILAVLVVATPCPLILAVPVAVFAGINRAAAAGAIVKHGAAIEQIGRAGAVLFDKTGTLTHGNPEVVAITPLNGHDADAALRAAGAVEQLSGHPLGRAVAAYALERFGTLPLPEDYRETAGRGVAGVVEGRQVAVGVPAREAAAATLAENATITVAVAIDSQPAALLRFADQLRPGVPAMVAGLRDLGVTETAMLTGDGETTARAIAAQAGIDHVLARLLPGDKVEAVRAATERAGVTVMVGDGINDAPALAAATVGVAMGARGAGISAEAADVVLLKDDVTALTEVMRISRRTRHIALQSIALGMGLSAACMALAAAGAISPTAGALLQEGIDILAVANALRAAASGE